MSSCLIVESKRLAKRVRVPPPPASVGVAIDINAYSNGKISGVRLTTNTVVTGVAMIAGGWLGVGIAASYVVGSYVVERNQQAREDAQDYKESVIRSGDVCFPGVVMVIMCILVKKRLILVGCFRLVFINVAMRRTVNFTTVSYMFFYYYIVYALCRISRVYLELGTAFAYWRVVILMSICEMAIALVCFGSIDIYEVSRFMSGNRLHVYFTFGLLGASLFTINESLILSDYDNYKREIVRWPLYKRRVCDVFVVLFFMLLSFLCAMTLKRLKAINEEHVNEQAYMCVPVTSRASWVL